LKLRTLTVLVTLGLLAGDALGARKVRHTGTKLTGVATDRVSAGGRLELRGEGLDSWTLHKRLQIQLKGTFSEPGEAPGPVRSMVLSGARVLGGGRIGADLTDEHIAAFGDRTLEFAGTIWLHSGTHKVPKVTDEIARMRDASLTLFPPDLQRVLAAYRVGMAFHAVTCRVGIEVDLPPAASWTDKLEGGVVVTGVSDEAEAAGLKAGDKLAALNGASIGTWEDLRLAALGATKQVAYRIDKKAGPQVKIELPAKWRGVPSWLIGLLLICVVCGVVLGLVMLIAGYLTVAERRIAGRMQFRIGPNRVGPQGLIQWLADGFKLIQKEDLCPDAADPIIFRIAPYIVFCGMFLSLVAVPFSSTLIPADLNIGILYILAVTSVVVIGLLMGGWSSNNKWSLIGGMRSAAQMVSYEVPAALAVLPVIIITGSLSMQAIIRNQGGFPWEWNVFGQPALFVAFFITFIAGLAEGNRTPFDLPEGESELVSGYNTEYSGFRFAVFFLGEFANIYVFGAIIATLFLGGWQLPTFDPTRYLLPETLPALTTTHWLSAAPMLFTVMLALAGVAVIVFSQAPVIWRGFHETVGKWAKRAIALIGLGVIAVAIGVHLRFGWPAWLGMEALRVAIFMSKALLISGVIIWLRWTLPRVRIDQLMMICWKYLVPFALATLVFTVLWEVFVPEAADGWTGVVLFAIGGVGLFIVFAKRVLASFRETDNPSYLNPFV